MTARYDWIAVGPHGVYAIMDAQLATKGEISAFKAQATRRGHTTELVTTDDACRRHLEYLERCAVMRSAAAEAELAAFAAPLAAQLDMFAARPPVPTPSSRRDT